MMGSTEWRRVAGFCALSAFALHGISLLAMPSGSGIWIDGDFDAVHAVHAIQVLPSHLPIGELPAPTAMGFVAATSGPVVVLPLSRPQASRGPPA